MTLTAQGIRMKIGYYSSNNPEEIDQILVDGTYYLKAEVYDHLIAYPGSIKVGIAPFPDLIPSISLGREKYVRSSPNQYGHDNLMSLPRD